MISKPQKEITKTNSLKRLTIALLLISTISTPYSQTSLDYKVFEKINEYRGENKLPELEWSDKIFHAAKHHIEYMIKDKVLAHAEKNNTPDPFNRVELYGVKWRSVGEILTVIHVAEVSEDIKATRIVQSWKESPGHNEIMLTKDFTHGASSCGLGTLKIHGDWPWLLSATVLVREY